MWLKLLEIAFIWLFLIVFLTQVIVPLVRMTPIFPWFRRERKLEEAMMDERQKGIETQLEKDLREMINTRKGERKQ